MQTTTWENVFDFHMDDRGVHGFWSGSLSITRFKKYFITDVGFLKEPSIFSTQCIVVNGERCVDQKGPGPFGVDWDLPTPETDEEAEIFNLMGVLADRSFILALLGHLDRTFTKKFSGTPVGGARSFDTQEDCNIPPIAGLAATEHVVIRGLRCVELPGRDKRIKFPNYLIEPEVVMSGVILLPERLECPKSRD